MTICTSGTLCKTALQLPVCNLDDFNIVKLTNRNSKFLCKDGTTAVYIQPRNISFLESDDRKIDNTFFQ